MHFPALRDIWRPFETHGIANMIIPTDLSWMILTMEPDGTFVAVAHPVCWEGHDLGTSSRQDMELATFILSGSCRPFFLQGAFVNECSLQACRIYYNVCTNTRYIPTYHITSFNVISQKKANIHIILIYTTKSY